jgi:hypothetical protein
MNERTWQHLPFRGHIFWTRVQFLKHRNYREISVCHCDLTYHNLFPLRAQVHFPDC